MRYNTFHFNITYLYEQYRLFNATFLLNAIAEMFLDYFVAIAIFLLIC
jgi:hypothetical protein